MTQFFNRQEAEKTQAQFKERFPDLDVWSVSDVRNEKTGEYERSCFTITYRNAPLVFISGHEQVNSFFDMCQYIASAIADNQQSEEVERGHSFIDQNGVRVIDGQTYTVDEYEAMAREQDDALYAEQKQFFADRKQNLN